MIKAFCCLHSLKEQFMISMYIWCSLVVVCSTVVFCFLSEPKCSEHEKISKLYYTDSKKKQYIYGFQNFLFLLLKTVALLEAS